MDIADKCVVQRTSVEADMWCDVMCSHVTRRSRTAPLLVVHLVHAGQCVARLSLASQCDSVATAATMLD